ncbi:MAG TPA: hypothetical protein VGL38_01190 [bacterium]
MTHILVAVLLGFLLIGCASKEQKAQKLFDQGQYEEVIQSYPDVAISTLARKRLQQLHSDSVARSTHPAQPLSAENHQLPEVKRSEDEQFAWGSQPMPYLILLEKKDDIATYQTPQDKATFSGIPVDARTYSYDRAGLYGEKLEITSSSTKTRILELLTLKYGKPKSQEVNGVCCIKTWDLHDLSIMASEMDMPGDPLWVLLMAPKDRVKPENRK